MCLGLLGCRSTSQNLEPPQRIALYCVVVRLDCCCGAHTQTHWHARRHLLMCTHTHAHKQRHLSPERVSVRSAGPACGQHCIVASLQLSWTFNSAGIQLFTGDSGPAGSAASSVTNNTCLHTATLFCSRALKGQIIKGFFCVKILGKLTLTVHITTHN